MGPMPQSPLTLHAASRDLMTSAPFTISSLTPERLTILRCLKDADPADLPMAPKEITSRTGLDWKMVARLLDSLRADGLIEKPEHGKYDIADFVLDVDLDAVPEVEPAAPEPVVIAEPDPEPVPISAAPVAVPSLPTDADALREVIATAEVEMATLSARRDVVTADLDRLNRDVAEAKEALASGDTPTVNVREAIAEASLLEGVVETINARLAAASAAYHGATAALDRERLLDAMADAAVRAEEGRAAYFEKVAEVEETVQRLLADLPGASRAWATATKEFYRVGVELGLPANGSARKTVATNSAGLVSRQVVPDEVVLATVAEVARRAGTADGLDAAQSRFGLDSWSGVGTQLGDGPLWRVDRPAKPDLSPLARQILAFVPHIAKQNG